MDSGRSGGRTCVALGLLFCALSQVAASAPTSRPLGFHRNLNARMCRMYDGTDWFGGDMPDMPLVGLGAFDCCVKCNGEEGCKAFVYRKQYDHCYLKDTVNSPSPCDDCLGRNNLEPGAPGCNVAYFKDRFGGDMPNMPIQGVSDPGYCCQQCKETGGCLSWVWRRDRHQCYLKNVRNDISQDCGPCILGDLDLD